VIPGKSYKPEEFVQMAWRRKWLIVLPAIIAGVGVTIWARTLPNRYQSDVTILVVPPRISQKIVDQDMNTTLRERLESMKQRLLSRSNVERIIQELNLYQEERKTMLMEQVVETMVKDANVNVVKGKGKHNEPNHFQVSFAAENPRTAMQVADRLAALFLNANLEEREQFAVSSSEFLKSQADDARKRLLEQEKKVEAFKRTYGAELPTQQGSNLQVMNSTTSELERLSDKMSKDRERQLELQRQLADESSMIIQHSSGNGGNAGGGKDGPVAATAAEQLEQARASLRALRLKFKPGHPDVLAAERQIGELEKKAETEALQQPLSGTGQPARTVTQAEANRITKLTTLRTELENIDRRLATYQAEEKRLQGLIATYKDRIEKAPGREVELNELQRDHDTLRATYQSFLKRVQDSELALDLERRQVGEQFRIVDPARLPERPSGPNRMRYSMIGLLVGLAFGVAIAGLLEYRDTSLRTEGDVLVALSLPVVALIPTMITTSDRRNSGRRRLVLMSAGALTLVVSVAAIAWKLRLFQGWIE
jgi:polysaccharide chain length determinant protein (PEP-CTERM system associated)